MAITHKTVAVVGSRKFRNYLQLKNIVDSFVGPEDWIVSGGAEGADSFAQRWAKETAHTIIIHYPMWRVNGVYDAGAGYKRNKKIVESADLVLAFYEKGRFQQGGTANTALWARRLEVPLNEYEEEYA